MSLPRALRDAAIAALVAFGLFVLLVGLRTDVGPTGGGLFLRQRWAEVGILCGIVFAGRLALNLLMASREARRAAAGHGGAPGRLAAAAAASGRLMAPALLAFALVLPFIPGMGRYELDLGIVVLTYVMLGWGLNIVVGLAGLLDLG